MSSLIQNSKLYNKIIPDAALGLSEKQAEKSRELFGENLLTKKKQRTFLHKLLESFGDPIIKILMCALAINVILSAHMSIFIIGSHVRTCY